jgi:hypothetical protein
MAVFISVMPFPTGIVVFVSAAGARSEQEMRLLGRPGENEFKS